MDTAPLEVMPVSTPAVPLSAIRQPALLYDASKRVCAANDLAEALAGRPLIGLSAADLVYIFRVTRPDGTAMPEEELPGVRAQAGHETVNIPVAITVADGRTLDILATASPIWEDGAVAAALVLWQTVTERRTAEAALFRSERRFRTLFESMQEGITLVEVCRDEHGGIVDCVYRELNPQAVKRMGVASAEEVIGRSVGELYGRTILDRFLPYVREAMGSGKPVTFIVPSPVEGEGREYFTSYVPMDADGLMALTLDITEIVRAQTEAEGERARLQGVLEAAPVGIFIGDEHGRGLLMNKAFFGVWGENAPIPGSVEEYREYRGRFADTGAEIRLEDWPGTRSLAGETCSIVADIARFDGTEATVIISAVPLRGYDGRVAGNVVVFHDISERRRTEEQLATSEEKYRRLFETMTEGFLLVEPILDEQGVPVSYRYLDANPALERLTHLKRDEIVGRDARGVLPGVEPDWIETFGRVALTGEPAHIEQFSQDLGGWYDVYVYSPAPGTAALVYTNITARKEAERALAGQKELLEHLIETVPVMISIHDPNLGSFHLNKAVERVTGWTDADAADGRLLERIYPDPAYRAMVEEYMHSLAPGFRDLIMTAKDGSTVPASWANFRLSNDVQVGVGIDLRERAAMVEELRQSREQFRLMGETLPYGVWLCNAHGGAEYVSQSFLDLLEMTEGEMREFGWTHRLPPEDVEPMLKRWLHCIETGEDWDDEHRVLGPDGAYHTVLTRGRPVRDQDGRVVAWVGINLDIDDRKRDEEALRASEQQYRSLIENSIDAVLLTAPDGRVLAANPEACRIFGMTEDELIAAGRDTIVDTTDPRLAPALEERMRTGRFRGELTYRRKDGTLFPGEVATALFTDRNGAVRTTMIIRDITDRKEAEATLADFTEQLKASNEELQRFAYVASHDLQEPLRSIVSFSQLLDRRYKGKLGPDADEYIAFIVEGGTRMQRLIADLLEVSRIETRAQPLAPVDAAAVVGEVLRSMDATLREASATVEVGELPAVMADAAQLEQVFANLVGNATKYRRPDAPPAIRIMARCTDGMVEFSVKDNGIGIEAEYFGRIFEMFRRLHTHDKYEGTGIGLAVVKKIVERHGGTIRVESTPGEGSTFVFTLPVA